MMAKPKKIYIHPGDMIDIHFVHENFEANASGFREQSHKETMLIRADRWRVAIGSPQGISLVHWSDFNAPTPKGKPNPDLPPSTE